MYFGISKKKLSKKKYKSAQKFELKMAYYQESIHLDKTKDLYNLKYTDLVEIENEEEQKEKINEQKKNIDFSTNAYLFFQEKEIIKKDILNLCQCLKGKYIEGRAGEEDYKAFPERYLLIRVSFVLEKYHEKPSLLADISKFIIVNIMDVAKHCLYRFVRLKNQQIKSNSEEEVKVPASLHELLRVIYILIKIRGAEKVKSFFPHEAKDFEPVIFCLASSGPDTIWESNYVMLTWLSLILLMPFDLKILDSNLSHFFFKLSCNEDKAGIVNVIIGICKKFLNSTTRTTAAASICLGRLFTRSDVKDIGALKEYVDWVCNIITTNKNEGQQSFFIAGLYNSLFSIFRILNRNEVSGIQELVFDLLFSGGDEGELSLVERTTTVRHFKTKVAQRLGLSLLPIRECKWLYKRTKKRLLDVFKGRELDSTLIQTNVKAIEEKMKDNLEDDEDKGLDEEVDLDKLEEIIGFLFDMLMDKDTVVRWSAAKGLGRITARLDLDLANDIIAEILNTFLGNGEMEWHGGLLAMGELCRRGLLLPENLPRVVPILKQGLLFEKNQGVYTSGSNVRDAACYVAWAFARAYEPSILQPYVAELSSTLLICSLYDKEVSCRRAAAAAFQENVGRQGNFPHGIEILTEADYFSLAVRLNSYTRVSVFVGHYQEYLKSFIEHLSTVKFKHVDIDIRKSAAATLNLFSCLDPKFMIENILPELIPQCFVSNFYTRHGAILSVAEIILGLSGKSHLHCMVDSAKDSIFLKTMTTNEKKMVEPGDYMKAFNDKFEELRKVNNNPMIPDNLKLKILNIVDTIEEKRLYRGKGGEHVRMAVCRLIQNYAYARIKIKKKQHRRYMKTLEECIKYPNIQISETAHRSLTEFSKVYHKVVSKQCTPFVETMLEKCTVSPVFTIRRGYSLGLSGFSKQVTEQYIDRFFECLEKNSMITRKKEDDDAETRKYAVRSFKIIFTKMGTDVITVERFRTLMKCCAQLTQDYKVDRRGDIGSQSREEAMYTFLDIITHLTSDEVKPEITEQYLTKDILEEVFGLLLQQLVEKIDKMRLIAGSILQKLVDSCYERLPDFAQKQKFKETFGNKYLREWVKKEQDRIDIKFDISLVDTSFLEYKDNKDFIYFWNIPECVYPLITPFAQYPTYTYYILRGISLSAGGITLSTHKAAVEAIVRYIDSLEESDIESRERVLAAFDKAIVNHRLRERFITPLFNCLNYFYDNEVFVRKELEEANTKILKKVIGESMKTKKTTKLMAATGLTCSIVRTTMAIRDKEGKTVEENLQYLKDSKMLRLMSHLLNHEYLFFTNYFLDSRKFLK